MAKGQQALFDELLAGALDILRLAASQRRAVLKRLAKLEKELIGKLSEENITKPTKQRINEVIKNANVSVANAYADLASIADLPAIGRYSAERTVQSFEIAMGLESIKLPKQDYFNSLKSDHLVLGHPAKAWWQKQDASTQFKYAQAIRQGATAGETNQQIVARIVGKSGQPGIIEATRREATSLVSTSVQSVANDARRATFDANSDIVKGLRQISTLDSHTSLVCVAYSGAEWNLKREPINGNTLPYLNGCPRHFGCRSIDVPITKTFKELGIDIPEPKRTTRASEDGQIAADTTMAGFLERKDKAYQDEVLGEGRAELWRDGKITLRDLVNGDGSPATLEQLNELVKKRGKR